MKKIQTRLGEHFRSLLSKDFDALPVTAVGQLVQDSIRAWVNEYLQDFDGSELTVSIHSANLRAAADFSAYNARVIYLLGKATLLSSRQRRGIVRTQIIEYGAICEAILLDLIQSVGIANRPRGKRPVKDSGKNGGADIKWASGGLFRTNAGSSEIVHQFTFAWLAKVAASIDPQTFGTMKTRLDALRRRRNLIHNATANRERYTDDLDAAKYARDIVVELAQRCRRFKSQHRLP